MQLQAKPPIELQQSLTELAGRLDAAQLNWASGYLAGYAAAGLSPSIESSPEAVPGPVLSIWYASETGNGRGVAERLASSARERGYAVDLASMADIQPRRIGKIRLLVLVVSTHGEGDPPADALAFHRLILSDRAPRLDELQFGVFALGDSSYPDFCQTGRELDEALAGLGAKRLLERVDVDVDFEDAEDIWRTEALEALKPLLETDDATQPRHLQVVRESAPTGHDRRNPWLAEVLEVSPLTVAPSAKQVSHIALATENSGLVWEPGDSLGLWPRHDRRLVEEVLASTGLAESEQVERNGQVLGLGDWLASRLELTRVVRPFVSAYAELADSNELRSLLEDRERFQQWAEARQVIDVLRQHPADLDAPTLVGMLRGLAPRLYSIASSALVNEDEVHLTVKLEGGEVDGHLRAGVASWQLVQAVKPGDQVSVYVEPNPNFRLPADPDRPVIMIGPGTGVAPFRAFIEHRQALGHKGQNWLFFGEQHRRSDFLYQLEWQRHLKTGALNQLSVAFSRDQTDKIYVQHRLREQAGAVYDWLEQGAHLYICGNQTMAAEVHDALVDIVCGQRQVERKVADEYLENLRIANRYQKDVY